jgi:hypothetical protein
MLLAESDCLILGILVEPEPGLFLSRDFYGDSWEINIMRPVPGAGSHGRERT